MNRIGRYEVEGRIGSGGFATVYRVRDTVLDSEVAAKVLAENWTDNAEIRDRFIREAQLLRRIDSHRVVTVHDIGEIDGGQPYFVMSLANRGTLEDRLMANTAAPSPADVASVADELAGCVRDVHNHDLIHRDIKPSNLLVTGGRGAVDPSQPPMLKEAERLLLGDFGLAKDIALQATGLTIAAGTGGYAAPEQMTHGGNPSRQTDLYAATAVMYRILTGTNPPNYDLLKEGVPFPDEQWWMAGALGRFFRRGMAYGQTDRHPSIDAWLTDFKAAYGGQQTVVPSGPTAAAPTSDPPSAFPSVPNATPDSAATSVLPQQPSTPSTSPTVNQPSYAAPSTPVTPPPHGYQAPPQNWPGGAVPDPRSLPAVSAPPTGQQGPYSQQPGYYGAPNVGYQNPQQHPQQTPYQSPHHGSQQLVRKRSRWPWMLLVLAILGLGGGAAIALVLVPTLETPSVEGPDSVRAGELATYTASFDGADDFRWTDFAGQPSSGPDFSFRGVVPGTVKFEVRAVKDGELTRAKTVTVEISEGQGAPDIIGPDEISVGEPTDYSFEADGATDPEWRIGQTHNTDQVTITGSAPGPFDITLIVTRDDGVRVGTRRTVQIVDAS